MRRDVILLEAPDYVMMSLFEFFKDGPSDCVLGPMLSQYAPEIRIKLLVLFDKVSARLNFDLFLPVVGARLEMKFDDFRILRLDEDRGVDTLWRLYPLRHYLYRCLRVLVL